MRTRLTAALVTAALVLGSAATVAAADMCLLRSNGALLILKAIALPGNGKCSDYGGFYPAEPSVGPFWVKGSACGSSDGDHISFVQTWMPKATNGIISGAVGWEQFTLNRRTLTGLGRQCHTSDLTCAFSYSIEKVACNPATVPVP